VTGDRAKQRAPRLSEEFFEALVKDDCEAVARLLAAGESIEATYRRSELTPLLLVASSGTPQLIELLLSAGADVTARDPSRCGVVIRAARGNRTDLLELFRKVGRDLDEANNAGSTALLLALLDDKFEAVTYLVANGADPDRANQGGLSARTIARNRPDGKWDAILGISR
jgi:ankyrin repeat protein